MCRQFRPYPLKQEHHGAMTPMNHEQVTELMTMARDHSENGRFKLADTLANLFLDRDATLNPRELDLVNDIIDQLLGQSNALVRREFAAKLAWSPSAPHRVVLSLAMDRIEVARDILIHSEILTDDDLVHLVDARGIDHARAIARRRAISEAVADALITTGDIDVMKTVAENLGARLSQKAMAILAETARFTAALRDAVMKRAELTPETATRLYWWVSQEMRRLVLQRFNIASGQIDEALAYTIEDLLNRYTLQKNDTAAMRQIADWLEDRGATGVATLRQVMRLGYFRLFNILFGRLTGLDLPVIEAVVAEEGGRSFAALCRAIGIERQDFVPLFLISRGARLDDQIVHPRELSRALAAFDRVSPLVAKQLLQTWCRDPAYLLDRATGTEGLDEIN